MYSDEFIEAICKNKIFEIFQFEFLQNTFFYAMLIGDTIWIVPLPGVEILTNQELYLAYDWEYWYRKWPTCSDELRARIALRYDIASSYPTVSARPSDADLAEVSRVAEFWYKHWTWWKPDMRRRIKAVFRQSGDDTLYHIDYR